MRTRSALLQKLVHFLTALTLLLKGIDKLEHPHGYWAIIFFFLASAAYIAAITAFHDRLHHRLRAINASVFAIESVATGAVAWVYFQEGKKFLPWLMAFASLMFLVALIVHLLKTRGNAPHPERVNGA
jgi:hypothetical protein